MKLEQVSLLAAAGWVLAWVGIVLLVHVGSTMGWILLVGAGIVPPCILLRMWRRPSQTMSESIREAIK
jgi:hypothetical protein